MQLRRFAPALLLLLAAVPAATHAQTSSTSVHLIWTATGDDSLSGTATQYDLRYSTATITTANFASATRASGLPTPGAPGTAEGFTVTGLQPSTVYWFAIKAGDDAGNWSLISNVTSMTTSAVADTVRPATAHLVVSAMTDSTATLSWTAVGDDSLTGTAASYEVRYSTTPITAANFGSATAVTGVPAPAAPGAPQSVIVHGLTRQVTYYFALRTIDDAGNRSALSNAPSATIPDTTAPAAIRNLTVGLP